MYCVYILKDKKTNRFYVGQTKNLDKRLEHHRKGWTNFGKRNKSIECIYCKNTNSRTEAIKIENFIKKQKSRSFIENLINNKIKVPLPRMK